jgi:hypothetical protein
MVYSGSLSLNALEACICSSRSGSHILLSELIEPDSDMNHIQVTWRVTFRVKDGKTMKYIAEVRLVLKL